MAIEVSFYDQNGKWLKADRLDTIPRVGEYIGVDRGVYRLVNQVRWCGGMVSCEIRMGRPITESDVNAQILI